MKGIFDNEIKDVISKYKDFFESTTADVAISLKGQKIFYYIDSASGEMYYVLEFKTAEQLEKIIQYEIADKMQDMLETGIHQISKELIKLDVGMGNIEDNRSVEKLAQTFDLLQKEVGKTNEVLAGFVEKVK